ncbi:DNA polymerase III subunit epsilon [Vibrio sp. 10N.286.49.C2]|uniref:3'-5' exonuclease n=1 Tax=unclassified Vibrio TaxID=2614977 RepID=UPI000CC8ED66|nr:MULTISPECIES: 3'-5' exonuclease [unclassified Vibrio]PMH36758.1 DNA polymerase III subunit epsilon [Vibrio sp. 10N.286.49.C2]PMH54746.1 DNA polymerase III subunit epsilon [Vibrio sp. 10N.286.49.B1]PMH79403.1 DNA polymerase III subunit epsilon [Vibrio sp. 10N.286.48.B7]
MPSMLKSVLNQFHVYQHFLKQRQKYVAQTALPDNIAEFLTTAPPEIDDLVTMHDYLVVDFETTGMDADQHSVLSLGWVAINNYTIELDSARHIYVESPEGIMAETAIINHIVPEMLQNGVSLDNAMSQLFSASKDRILIAHGSMIEAAFVEKYLSTHYGVQNLPIMWLDTLAIEKAMANAVSKDTETDVRLSETRARYGLPEYNGHDALIDAIATAELFLAQSTRLFHKQYPCIGKLFRLSQ